MTKPTRILAMLALLATPALPFTPAPTAVETTVPTPVSPEYRIKAAFLYNFADFTTWPKEAFESKTSPIVVGVLGRDPFGKTLEATFRDKKIGKRRFELHRWKHEDDVGRCHILFIPRSERAHAERMLAKLRGRHILIVSESEGFIGRGGILNFYIEKKKIRFEVQVDEAKRARLTISSHLLKLGRIVRD